MGWNGSNIYYYDSFLNTGGGIPPWQSEKGYIKEVKCDIKEGKTI